MPTALEKAVRGAALLETPGDKLMHPEWVDGKRLWLEPAVKDICDRIQDGCSCCGWEGDPRMAVYYDGEEARWYVLRLAACGDALCPDCGGRGEHYFAVTRSAPNARIDHAVIDMLVAHDTRRGFSASLWVAQGDKVVEHRFKAEMDALHEHVADKLAFAFSKHTPDRSLAPRRHIV